MQFWKEMSVSKWWQFYFWVNYAFNQNQNERIYTYKELNDFRNQTLKWL